jgi:hypothetical protein
MSAEQRLPESDDRFEERMRSYRPVAPRPLVIPHARAPWRALVFACALVAIIAGRIHFSDIGRPRVLAPAIGEEMKARDISGTVTVGRLNQALRASDHDFDQFLIDGGRDLLPHEHRGTALYVLSKE